jgi:hypothetical protein
MHEKFRVGLKSELDYNKSPACNRLAAMRAAYPTALAIQATDEQRLASK